ncbi:hypothetical protein [Sphingobacterium bambusae]|uniref:Uncharacterized protein n=1 Tax=Sphingobacterium bambusae TaxID=662858 RepID=A0ABW6BDI3_9SPHI|nr:hypothetical protein [Sphingobacterium bambusae]WPL48818.1 hypothetical protein SCB77_22970 [Sphingobacterium bambusae]
MSIYPVEILPCPEFKTIVCDLSDYFLIRTTKSSEGIIDALTGKIDVQAICSPKEQIEDLSTSLFGIYNHGHVPVELTQMGKREYAVSCNPDQQVDPVPVFDTHFTLQQHKGSWMVAIKDIKGKIADYTMGENRDQFQAICNVLHTPMLWNYWHFSVRWYLVEQGQFLADVEDPKLAGKYKKRLGHEARSLIAQFAVAYASDVVPINHACYIR